MNNIKIINDNDLNNTQKADLYINVFGEQPRNEWYQCNDCKKLYSISEVKKNEIIQCLCWWKLENFYDINKVENDLASWSEKQWYIWKLASTLDGELVWFILWRETNIDDINQSKLWLDDMQINILKDNIKNNFYDFDFDRFFYAAEIWVNNSFRDLGIASKLFQEREANIIKNNIKYILVRTIKNIEKPYLRYIKQWFVDVFDYNDQQDRVLMVKMI